MEAMGAFSDSRQFLGLICTACMPRNLASPQLSGADLLIPAQDSFFGFSVFKRHYSGNVALFAMALFLGKPAIFVEHHEFFRNGTAGLEEHVKRLKELRPDIQWRPLAEIDGHHERRRREHPKAIPAVPRKDERECGRRYAHHRRTGGGE